MPSRSASCLFVMACCLHSRSMRIRSGCASALASSTVACRRPRGSPAGTSTGFSSPTDSIVDDRWTIVTSIEFSPSMCDPQPMGEETADMGGRTAGADSARHTPLGLNFRLLWTSSGLSNLADGILKVSLPLLAVRLTDSPTLIAGLAFALTLPWLLFALPAGALSDRVDRRRAMLVANVIRAGLMAAIAIAIVVGAGSIWALYVAAFCIGVAETIYDTSAQSILPQLVTPRALPRANALLFATETTTNQFVGPPLGGVLVAAGAAIAFAVPAALWAVAVGILLLLRGSFRIERT